MIRHHKLYQWDANAVPVSYLRSSTAAIGRPMTPSREHPASTFTLNQFLDGWGKLFYERKKQPIGHYFGLNVHDTRSSYGVRRYIQLFKAKRCGSSMPPNKHYFSEFFSPGKSTTLISANLWVFYSHIWLYKLREYPSVCYDINLVIFPPLTQMLMTTANQRSSVTLNENDR